MKPTTSLYKKILTKLFLRTLGRIIPSDVFAHRFPVSVKGVCFIDDKVILLKNERGEWDLPGGKLAKREAIDRCLVREFEEELSIAVRPHRLLRAATLRIMNTVEIIVVIYSCLTQAQMEDLELSEENFALGAFTIEEIGTVVMPPVYREAIRQAHRELI